MVMVAQDHQKQEDDRFQTDEDKERVTSRVNLVTTPKNDIQGHSGIQNGACVVARTEIDTLENDSQGCSTLCSDVEDDLDNVDSEAEEGWITELSVPALQHISNCISQFNPEPPPNFGDVCVKNSSNVNLGNKTFYKGPVTIKQFVYTNPDFSTVNDVIENERVTNQRDVEASEIINNGTSTVTPNSADSCNNGEVHRLWTKKYAAMAIASALALVLLILVAISVVFLSRGSDVPETPEISINRDALVIDGVRTVGRDEWLAQPPASQMDKLRHPVPYVIITHTATNFCDTQSACTHLVRLAQNFHIESKNWSDIAYNFLTGGDGLAYVGRGWDYAGAHSFGYNIKSIGIAFIGTFTNVSPPLAQIRATQKLIEFGVKKKYIADDYKLLAHRQVSPTTSPGDALFNIIRTWPHWTLIS
ncbi:peptidoglycan-recognition protein LA [Cephus cinctus]|uniref:Peptidoglycan-recognition protein LA n=1 Tax=Cephus cinctus TaxID=211228 RepID=A0AAJ7C912_CEPCN|nr:peptidoglycan-recognition protein LA [Cephus cinctus]